MKDVDYISGVSGGTYAATAFASHLVALQAPQRGESLDVWYRRAVAKMTPGSKDVGFTGEKCWKLMEDEGTCRCYGEDLGQKPCQR